MGKVTFKKHPRETGLAAVGHSQQSVDIKFNKKKFGLINAPNWSTKDNKWGVSITIKDPNQKAGWCWIFFKVRHENEQAARDWITANYEKIAAKYTIHFFED